MKTSIKKVVIPVAGLGTRSLPYTKVVPKEMLPIIDKPTIHYIVEEAIRAGLEQVIFVTSRGKSGLEDYFDASAELDLWLSRRGKKALAEEMRKLSTLCEVITVRQKEPLGLGHAVYCAAPIVGREPFAVCLGDEIFPPWDEINTERPPLRHWLKFHWRVRARPSVSWKFRGSKAVPTVLWILARRR